uniref:Uncharacterized protein n=1 Tax=Rhizophora mucronata TaxID=61149 RepID=A0A2P2PXM8_RHIMU
MPLFSTHLSRHSLGQMTNCYYLHSNMVHLSPCNYNMSQRRRQ